MYSPHNSHKFEQHFKRPLAPKLKTFLKTFVPFLDRLHSLNILEVIHSERCGYLNAQKLLFQSTVGEKTSSRLANTAAICGAALLPYFSINPAQIGLENISF